MKKVFILLIGFSLCFISCSKKERNQTDETTIIQETKIEKEETSTEIKVEEKAKEYVYENNLRFSSYFSEDGDLFYVKEGIPYLYNTNIPGEIVIDKNGFKHVLFEEADYDILVIDGYKNYFYKWGSSDNPPKIDFKTPSYLPTGEIYILDYSFLGGLRDADVKASSYLTDKRHEYKPENVKYTMYTGDCEEWGFTETVVPWVEGKDGYGIGEWIEYDISSFSQWREDLKNRNARLYILNGYVNPKLPHLYKENSRIKKATLIIDDSTEIKIEFDDIVEFKCVELGRPFTKVRLIIDEVYKGTKYDDTCITAITVDWEYN